MSTKVVAVKKVSNSYMDYFNWETTDEQVMFANLYIEKNKVGIPTLKRAKIQVLHDLRILITCDDMLNLLGAKDTNSLEMIFSTIVRDYAKKDIAENRPVVESRPAIEVWRTGNRLIRTSSGCRFA